MGNRNLFVLTQPENALLITSALARETRLRARQTTALLVCCILAVGSVVVEYFAPLTRYAWLNGASEVSLSLVAGGFLGILILAARQRRSLPAHVRPPDVITPTLDAPGVAYALAWKRPVAGLWALAVLGAVASVNLVPPVVFWVDLIRHAVEGVRSSAATGLGSNVPAVLVAGLLEFIGLLGLCFVYIAPVQATARAHADTRGLSIITWRRTRLLPWSSVLDVSWGRGPRGTYSYVVQVQPGRRTRALVWPAADGSSNATSGSDDALAITPDEFAALLSAKIGQPIRVRGQG